MAKKSAKKPAKKTTKKPAKKPAAKAAKKPAAKAAKKPGGGGSWKPADWHVLTVACAVKRGAQAVGFYQALFGAKVRSRLDGPGGSLAHADLAIGDSNFMIGEPWPGMPEQNFSMMIYTKDPDALFHQALASGCEQLEGMADQFWGDRTGRFKDPFGNSWMVAKRVENVSPAEMARRAQQQMSQQAA